MRITTAENTPERYVDTGLRKTNISNIVVKIRDMDTRDTESKKGDYIFPSYAKMLSNIFHIISFPTSIS